LVDVKQTHAEWKYEKCFTHGKALAAVARLENENIARNDKQDVTFPTVTHRQPALQSARGEY